MSDGNTAYRRCLAALVAGDEHPGRLNGVGWGVINKLLSENLIVAEARPTAIDYARYSYRLTAAGEARAKDLEQED